MTAYVLSPFYPVADKIDTSHRAGWARYWAKELGATLLTTKTMGLIGQVKKGDELLLYHGMEWNGQLNLQSGLTDELKLRAAWLVRAAELKVKTVSLDVPMPPYGKLFTERGAAWGASLTKALTKALNRSHLLVPHERPKHVIIGDSHALSLYRPGAVIYRTDGQTLHGALERRLYPMLNGWTFETHVELTGLELLTSYFGNIDIRHHLLRQPDPRLAVRKLVEAYLKQLDEVRTRYNIKHVEVTLPLPIENEARVLPKTGWYKGTPFFGSWAERTKLRDYLADRLKAEAKKYGFSIYAHPKHFVNGAGELSFDVMECPRSVHIRPSEYRLVQEKKGW